MAMNIRWPNICGFHHARIFFTHLLHVTTLSTLRTHRAEWNATCNMLTRNLNFNQNQNGMTFDRWIWSQGWNKTEIRSMNYSKEILWVFSSKSGGAQKPLFSKFQEAFFVKKTHCLVSTRGAYLCTGVPFSERVCFISRHCCQAKKSSLKAIYKPT